MPTAPTKEAIETLAKFRYTGLQEHRPDLNLKPWDEAEAVTKRQWSESAEEWLRRPENAGKTGLEDVKPEAAPAA